MDLKDFCLTDVVGPQRQLDSSSLYFPLDSSLSPFNLPFLLPSPASSSSSSSCGASCGELFSVSRCRSSAGGGATPPDISTCFLTSRTSCFSEQVDSVLRGTSGLKRLCLVCGDLASGFHYGVASCEACKAFFKRTIQGKIEYSCPVTNECEITKRRRKSCQACRFQKCLQAGMMIEGVRVDRVRGGRHKYKRVETGLVYFCKTPYSLPARRNKVISHLLLTEPPPLAANQDDSSSDSGLRTLLTLCDLLNRELLVLISWVKQIPGFSGLSLVDQMSLLQSGWMEVVLVGVAWRSQAALQEELVFAGNLWLDEAQCREAGLVDLYEALCQLTARYRAMELSTEEAVTLKAVALANSDADPLDCPDSVQRFQDELHEALQEYEVRWHEPRRAGRLLMSLPLLRQSAGRAVHALRRTLRSCHVPLHKLLAEMLDASSSVLQDRSQ